MTLMLVPVANDEAAAAAYKRCSYARLWIMQ